jgi:hypothetical protein
MLGIDEHRFLSRRYFQDPSTTAWTRFETWMTPIVDLDTRQVLCVVDGRDRKGLGASLFVPGMALTVQVVVIDPSASTRPGGTACLLLRGDETLSCRSALRLAKVFAVDDPTGTLQAVWKSRNNSAPCSAPAPWTTPRRPRRYSRSWSRQPYSRRQTGSTAPSADGRERSRCSSLPAPLPAR